MEINTLINQSFGFVRYNLRLVFIGIDALNGSFFRCILTHNLLLEIVVDTNASFVHVGRLVLGLLL